MYLQFVMLHKRFILGRIKRAYELFQYYVVARNEMTKQSKNYYIYILTNFENGTLYTGITNDLIRRVYEHREKLVEGFTKKYDLDKLVYYEIYESPEQAILREKQIKGGSRKKKLDLINNFNRDWKDLYEDII